MSTPDVVSRSHGSGRLTALDGLRGVAALVVLLHHTLLLNPEFPGSPPGADFTGGTFFSWLSFSPLKVFTAGTESVIVFFVLSGLVVSIPALRHGFDWFAYFPRRIARLMIPVIASVLVAAAFVVAIPQKSTQDSGTWLSRSSTPSFSWGNIVSAMDLFGGDAQINNPLWSLRWEVIFSLLLPVFVILAALLKRWWFAGIAGAVLLTWVGVSTGADSLRYLPAFFVGAMIAVGMDGIRRFTDAVNRRSAHHVIWLAITLSGAMLLIASWLTGPLPDEAIGITNALKALTPLAAAIIVVACIGWSALGRLLSWAPTQFVGKISFSLYLTHVPILIFSSYLLADAPLIVAQIFGVSLALVVSVAFWWILESRSHEWSKRIGARATVGYATVANATRQQRERRNRAADDTVPARR
ncbi:MAG: acyltransferase [Terrimesophilobacter sp.]